MDSRNASPSPKSSDYSEIDDILIVPPKPVAQKEYNKELVPDISAVSDIVDNGSTWLPTPNNFLHASINHTSYKQQVNKSSVFKTGRDIAERTNTILDSNARLPVMTYLNPGCQSCIINHAVMTNNRYSGQYVLPKTGASNHTVITNNGYNGQYALPKISESILLPVGNEQFDKEIKLKSEDDELNSNKICHKHIELDITASSNHKSIPYNHAQHSFPMNSNVPETFQTEGIPNCYCSKDQQSKFQKSFSKSEIPVLSDSGLGESRKSEEICEKEMVDRHKLRNMNIVCPTCFRKPGARKPCTCNFSAKEYNTTPPASSDALSRIWEYLKQQDEKIDSIHEKVSNFLSQHTSCLIASQGNEISTTESDIPYILNILEVHSDKIRELQDQINLLKSSEHLSSPANNKIDESGLKQAQTLNCVNTKTCNEAIHCPYAHNVMCHEQKQKITKTSTSTMTSFVIENNDKFVYHEKMTVVSGLRENKETSCLVNEHDSPTIKKHLDEENVNSNSQKRKSHKLNNCSPSLKSNQNVSLNSSSDAPDPNDNQAFKTSHKSEKKSKRASRHKVIDKKTVDDRSAKDYNVEEKKKSPALKAAALKPHPRSSEYKERNSTSPKVTDNGTIRDLGNKKITTQISASSSSRDSEYKRTKPKQKVFDKTKLEETESDSEESTTVSKYGLSSKHLSKATKRYLDTYGLRRT